MVKLIWKGFFKKIPCFQDSFMTISREFSWRRNVERGSYCRQLTEFKSDCRLNRCDQTTQNLVTFRRLKGRRAKQLWSIQDDEHWLDVHVCTILVATQFYLCDYYNPFCLASALLPFFFFLLNEESKHFLFAAQIIGMLLIGFDRNSLLFWVIACVLATQV